MTQFSDLGLAAPIQAALDSEGYVTPTPIQAQAIPPLLKGRDLLGIAQTGTGKTAAFALPALHHLSANPKRALPQTCRMLVLAPTRELASQIADSMRAYGKNLKLSVATVFGGVPVGRQIRQMQIGVDILVATPGRLLDLIDQRALSLRAVEIFVLDEADQMLDLGFIHALKRIVPLLPKQRQSLFFSATMPKTIGELADKFLTDPVKVAVAPVASTAERVEQFLTYVNQAEKQALLTLKLRELEIGRALVFSRTKHGADRIVRHLGAAGINASAIHGNKSQPQREKALAAFRDGSAPILVATDIAARGIDVDGVTHVFNFDIPDVPEQYVHRIGRTARAGASGMAMAFVSPEERGNMKDVTKLTRVHPTELPLPENFVVELKRLPLPKMGTKDDRERDALGSRGRNDGRGGGRGRPQHGQVHRGGTNRETSRDASPRGPVANPLGGRGHPGPQRSNWSPVEAGRPDRAEQNGSGERPQRSGPGGNSGNGGNGRRRGGRGRGGNGGGQPRAQQG
ncbi:DEAD/DEAH box helicase [Sphingomonas sp. CGMCC 1.13654]|uniref:DEAD-box ATP-dependent RNA helicase RhpA n=1 Tax=Sphingomonas chungangi TaxID=2683589 RepID=A0A838L945_9SPHN|nr:DEAD/DEAH box helicase [Sphingomonas chungangi]MBA2935059.1 DEAD/DEAH box helicase [Sphingomonas chungangi]MVW54175.1 DEAD/DEAH box helicase [Sphingomonas chungangi]